MNLRFFLTGSSLVLLSWMAVSYVKVSPETGFAELGSLSESQTEVVLVNTDEGSELAAQ